MKRFFEEQLEAWKGELNRTPLIVRGARQVGKSHSVREFGQAHFRNVCEVNLELDRRLLSCFRSRDAHAICEQLELILNQDIVDGETLLFIDEIQASQDALISLRSFKEKRPNLHVIAAGSLLEFSLNDDKSFSFPVGRVSFYFLQPMSFREFLLAMGQEKIVKNLAICSISRPCSQAVHEHLLNLLRTYFVVGGMPEVVATYQVSQSLRDAQRVQSRLMQAFVADFAKYGRRYDFRRLQSILTAAPKLVGRRFKYSHVDEHTKARDMKQPLLDLERAGLLRIVRASRATGLPLGADEREGVFKLQLLDVGLMLNALGLPAFDLPIVDFLFANDGALAEQFVGQELLANREPSATSQLHFWARDVSGSEAEVDFVFPFQGRVIPIEVKSGTTGSLRSIRLFMQERNTHLGVRISQHPLSFSDGILSVPLYMIHELERILAELRSVL